MGSGHGSFRDAILTFIGIVLVASSSTWAQGSATPPLKVAVPLKMGFHEFVSWSGDSPQNATDFNGFAVQVFEEAARRLDLSYYYSGVGNGKFTPEYDDMVQDLEDGEYDAVVADLTITEKRMRQVDFTLPYISSSVVMVTTFKYGLKLTLWDFLTPFTLELWLAILALFLVTGLLVFVLETKNPDFRFISDRLRRQRAREPPPEPGPHRPPRIECQSWLLRSFKRLVNVYWFTSLSIFFSHRESLTTHLGRIVTLAWLLVVLIFTSSFTASLATLLSDQHHYPRFRDFEALRDSNARIGYKGGSFMPDRVARLGIQRSRLVPYDKEEYYTEALLLGPERGGVAAIVDELPYVLAYLASECQFTIAGGQIASVGGFGFAFRKNSNITEKLSMAILAMEGDGTLQRLRDFWLGTGATHCDAVASAKLRMQLTSFGGLFIIVAGIFVIALGWRLFLLGPGECCNVSVDRPLDEESAMLVRDWLLEMSRRYPLP